MGRLTKKRDYCGRIDCYYSIVKIGNVSFPFLKACGRSRNKTVLNQLN